MNKGTTKSISSKVHQNDAEDGSTASADDKDDIENQCAQIVLRKNLFPR
jgi:hypothetical protein